MNRSPRAIRRAAAVASTLFAGAAVALATAPGAALRAAEPPTVYITTTADGGETHNCLKNGRHCTLRDAIETVAQSGQGGRIVARFCGLAVPGPYCLGQDDPNYDAVAHVWRIGLTEAYGFDITGTNVTIDFSAGVPLPGWTGPADNVIEVDTGDGGLDWAFGIDGAHHVLKGFNVRGTVKTAAVVVYNGATDVTLDAMAFAGVTGDAVRIRDEHTEGNRIVGTQCGWFGPADTGGALRPPEPVTGACVEVSRGAHDNAIGVPGGAANVFADAGIGVHLTGRGTRANIVQGARIDGNGVGIRVSAEALETRLTGNTVVRSGGSGIEIAGASWKTSIVDNRIGIEGDEWPAPTVLANDGWGIDIAAPGKDSRIEGNRIQGNGAGGIRVAGVKAEQNTFVDNRITGHAGPAIAIEGGANRGVLPPELHLAAGRIVGRTCPQCDVQLFSDAADEAAALEGGAKADNNGNVVFTPSQAFRHRFITALTTDPNGNSSALGAPLDTVPGPTPTATTPRPALWAQAYLPIGWRGLP